MKVVVIGSGSIGMLMAFYLSKKGHPISLLTNRKEQALLIEEKGLHMIHQDQQIEVVSVDAQPFSITSEYEQIDLAIIAVKSYQVKEVLTKIEHINVRSILFVQNGMGHTELFSQVTIPELSVAVIEHGALRMNDYTVHHTGIGQLRWGYVRKLSNQVEAMFSNLDNPLFPIRYEQDWQKMLQRKLVVNACINPLTALLHVKNGELITNMHHLKMVKAVFLEVMTILNVGNQQEMWEHVCDVCQHTSENRSSMLSDIENNRQTEIDSILGYLIHKAEQQHYQADILTFLYHGIKSKEEQFKQEV